MVPRITVLFGVLKALNYKTSMPTAVMFLSFGRGQCAVTKEEKKKGNPYSGRPEARKGRQSGAAYVTSPPEFL